MKFKFGIFGIEDEARFVQKRIYSRVYAEAGTRLTCMRQNGFKSPSIIRAIHPGNGDNVEYLRWEKTSCIS